MTDIGVEEILAAASRALGTALSEPEDLGGSRRSVVLRVRTADGGTVVVKAFGESREARAAFVAEASGLRHTDLGPGLLAVDAERRLVVMTDLGIAPNLADKLLGGDPAAAAEALTQWATAYGRLAATTAGRQAELAALRAEYGATGATAEENWIAELARTLPEVMTASGVAVPDGLDADIALAAGLHTDEYQVFSPGDICPDNHLLTPDGLRPLDFEWAVYHSVFLDAAYTRMPFSSCWCVSRLPEDLARDAELRYRAEIVTAFPALADDAVWEGGLQLAVATWTAHVTTMILPRSAESDRGVHLSRMRTPTFRQVLRHRWGTATSDAGIRERLPALALAFERLLAATEDWRVGPLPGYPAFAPIAGPA
jgi:hypothetical protein